MLLLMIERSSVGGTEIDDHMSALYPQAEALQETAGERRNG
jgi:hypothetical protein